MDKQICNDCFLSDSNIKCEKKCGSNESFRNDLNNEKSSIYPKVVLNRLKDSDFTKYGSDLLDKLWSIYSVDNKSNDFIINAQKSPQKPMRLMANSNSLFKSQAKHSNNSKVDSIPEVVIKEEKDSKSMTVSSEYWRCLSLIPTKDFNTKSMDDLKTSFPLREISRISPLVRDHLGHILLEREVLIPMKIKTKPIDNIQKLKENNENCYNTRTKSDKELTDKEKDRQKVRETKRLLKSALKLKRKSVKLMTRFPFSTPLGLRVCRSLPETQLNSSDILKINEKKEWFCKTNQCIRSVRKSKYNHWKCSSIERKSFATDFTKGSNNCFSYSFNRRQRLEKIKRMETGLNWKSRLMARNCKQLSFIITKTKKCLICDFDLNNEHNCDESKLKSDVQSLDCDPLENSCHSVNNFETVEPLGTEFFERLDVLLLDILEDNLRDECVQNQNQFNANHLQSYENLKIDALNKMRRVSVVIKPIDLSDFFHNQNNHSNEDKSQRICSIDLDDSDAQRICEINLDLETSVEDLNID